MVDPGPDCRISTTIGLIGMKCYTALHGTQRMKPVGFADHLIFPVVPLAGWHLGLCFFIRWIGISFSTNIHGAQIINLTDHSLTLIQWWCYTKFSYILRKFFNIHIHGFQMMYPIDSKIHWLFLSHPHKVHICGFV